MGLSLQDLLWLVTATSLVLTMQAGFLCLETGLTRSKNSINVAMKNVVDFVISLVVFWAVGFGLLFGGSAAGWIGESDFVLDAGASQDRAIFFLFQAMFCATTVTIVSGAVAERMTFSGYIVVSIIVAGLVYPLFGHWAWNGLDTGNLKGWLGASGYVDWAGSSVVHQAGGWVALALLLLIGPRLGRFDEKTGEPRPVAMSNLPLAALGVLLLCFGWIGFNGGSTLKLEPRIGMIIANTCLAAASGGLAGLVFAWMRVGKADVGALLNGILGGLVAITANCHAVSFASALAIGAVGGVLTFGVDRLLLRLGIDDAVGAVPVHLGAGIWGILAVALFGKPELLGTGLGFTDQLIVQVKGLVACFAVAFLMPLVLFQFLARILPLRVPPDAETVGLNVAEHGARTEVHDLYEGLQEQARTGDMSLRIRVDPFTEAGQIALRYNHVMDRLEEAVAKTEAIVRVASDAILIFSAEGMLLFHNEAATRMFGYAAEDLALRRLSDLLSGGGPVDDADIVETRALRADGGTVPVEVTAGTATIHLGRLRIFTLRNITERKRAERQLRESEARFKAVFNEAALGMVMIGGDGTLIGRNATFAAMLDRAGEEAGDRFDFFVHADDRGTIQVAIADVVRGATARQTVEARLLCGDGRVIWARLSLTGAVVAGHAKPVALAVVEDITEARRSADALRLAASVFENTAEAIAIFDAHGAIDTVNGAFTRILGYSGREARGLSLPFLGSARYGKEHFATIFAALKRDGAWSGEIMMRCKDGSLVPMWTSLSDVRGGDGVTRNRVAVFNDLTERKQQEEAVWRHANFDAVTGLPNRRLFLDRLGQAIEQARRTRTVVGLMFLDLDRFKAINDSLGHKAGDDLLALVARRLSGAVRASDTVARLGGDEFTVIVTNVGEAQALDAVARKMVAAVAQPMTLDGAEVGVSTSVGIAVFPGDAESADDLLRKADAALYHAKALGRNNHQFFTDDLNRRMEQRIQFERNFVRGLNGGEVFMVYQPQVDLLTRDIGGLEALVRWNAPERGVIPPDEFIPLAEETGLAPMLGAFVVRRVCADIRHLLDRGLPVPRVSINVSARELGPDVALEHTILSACREERVEPAQIAVEVTENSLMASEEHASKLLVRLNEAGVMVSLDDFGKGYSSLARLKKLPVQSIKIDREFVRNLPGDDDDEALVTAMIAMARGMEVEVIAEGVETEEQAACLVRLGCGKAQGYLFGRPMPLDEVVVLLGDGAVRPAAGEPVAA